VQIELALSETHAPIEFLGETIRALADILNRMEMDDAGNVVGPDGDRPVDQLAALRSGLCASIEKLQFHDRMVQHLSHVRDYLASIANKLNNESGFNCEDIGSTEEAWADLNSRLRTRLISDAEREMFDLVLGSGKTPNQVAEARKNDYAAQGSIELF
jgi:hypothetical protein